MTKPAITVNVDPTNPGQFFACCGLLELADRLWPGAEGWFRPDGREFYLQHPTANDLQATTLIEKIASCAISSSMSEEKIERLKKLNAVARSLRTDAIEREKEDLKQLRNTERINVGHPFDMWLDWWNDTPAGCADLKTWAGLQFILTIVRGLHGCIKQKEWRHLPASEWLFKGSNEGSLPLYFDSDIGNSSSARDVGYSLDEIKVRGSIRPLLDLLTFVGLQRFRPEVIKKKDTYRYTLFLVPQGVVVASVICAGGIVLPDSKRFQFRLLYRTDYLKSFLPAIPLTQGA